MIAERHAPSLVKTTCQQTADVLEDAPLLPLHLQWHRWCRGLLSVHWPHSWHFRTETGLYSCIKRAAQKAKAEADQDPVMKLPWLGCSITWFVNTSRQMG